ncbi:MAG: protease modulator HflC [Rhodospirillales bacterium]|nr:protease modulator HflC [Rhodospirillales bacterium]
MKKSTLIGLGIALVVIAALVYTAAFTVRQTQQALVLQFGNPVRVDRDPGLKFKIPFVQRVDYFSKQILDLDPPTQEVLLADQKRINVDSFARYRIIDPLRFRQRANTEENFRQIFGAQLNSAVRTEVARIGLADLLSIERSDIMERITQRLKDVSRDFGVEVFDVRIGRADLPEAASQSVFNRMRSARVAQAAQLRAEGEEQKARIQAEADRERTVIIADATRQSQILRGEGDAERTRILNQVFNLDPKFFDFYRSLEAYQSLATPETTMVLRPDSDFFRFFVRERGGPITQGTQQ